VLKMSEKIADHLQGILQFKRKDSNLESKRISQFRKYFSRILFHNRHLGLVVDSVRKALPIAITIMTVILIDSAMIMLDLERRKNITFYMLFSDWFILLVRKIMLLLYYFFLNIAKLRKLTYVSSVKWNI